MRLGVVGMLPSDFRQITSDHLDAIRALKLTGAAFHAPGAQLAEVTDAQCQQVRQTYADAGMDLPQFGIGFGHCLFDPDEAVRREVIGIIGRGIEVAAQLGAHTCLIRTGSLNPSGSYSPDRRNHSLEAHRRLVATLRSIADKAEAEDVHIVIETHVLTIMDSPETNALVLAEVNSTHMGVVMDYVNHFQAMHQVFNSAPRLEHIFRFMAPLAPVGHCKDIKMSNGLVTHIDEEIPGDGELDLAKALGLWQTYRPDGYMLLEHLPDEKYPRAAANVHQIIADAGIPLH